LGLPSNNPEVTQGGMEWPVWSSDGKAIFYRRWDTPNYEQSLVVRDLETGRERELYRGNPRPAGENEQSMVPAQPTEMANAGNWGASNLAVSPDGQQLAFVWSTLTSQALKVIPTTESGETRELLRVQSPERLFQPAWMPDGGHLLFGKGRIEGQEPRLELWRIPAEGGEPQDLGLAMEGLLLYGLSIHPDGQRIAFTAGRDLGSQTWVMENVLPELKAAK
jgi:Tol biopolymer transport system component